MTVKGNFSLVMSLLVMCLLTPSAALADSLTLSLSSPVQNGGAGSTFTFEATVSAPTTNAARIFLNSDAYTVDSSLTLDDSGFFGFPVSLVPGDSYTGVLFTITLPTNVVPGIYSGSFEILRGANGAASDALATTGFQINATPEPTSMLLLATGLGLLAFVVCRSKQIPSVS